MVPSGSFLSVCCELPCIHSDSLKRGSTFVIITQEKLVWLLKNNFCTAVSRKNILEFRHTWKTRSPQLNNVFTLPFENITSHFVLLLCNFRILPTVSSVVWNKVHQVPVQRKQKVCSKCPPLARTQVLKRVGHWSTVSSISDCPKPRHTCSRRCRSSSMSYSRTWQWCHIYATCKMNK